MFGFLKKKFGKSADEARPVEQAAEEQAAAEVPAEDLAGVKPSMVIETKKNRFDVYIKSAMK